MGRLEPAVVAWALGFAVFLAFAGGAVVAPPDPVSQALAGGALLLFLAPLVYWVLDADRVADHEVRSRRPFPYLVAASLGGVLAVALVPLAAAWPLGTVVRGVVFLGVVGGVSWLAVNWRRDAG